MSVQSVQTVIGRAVLEPEYRALLFRDPAQALAAYELSEPEAASLRSLTPESFDAATAELETRISKSELLFSRSQGDAQKSVTQ
jgi:hypothetical protein